MLRKGTGQKQPDVDMSPQTLVLVCKELMDAWLDRNKKQPVAQDLQRLLQETRTSNNLKGYLKFKDDFLREIFPITDNLTDERYHKSLLALRDVDMNLKQYRDNTTGAMRADLTPQERLKHDELMAKNQEMLIPLLAEYAPIMRHLQAEILRLETALKKIPDPEFEQIFGQVDGGRLPRQDIEHLLVKGFAFGLVQRLDERYKQKWIASKTIKNSLGLILAMAVVTGALAELATNKGLVPNAGVARGGAEMFMSETSSTKSEPQKRSRIGKAPSDSNRKTSKTENEKYVSELLAQLPALQRSESLRETMIKKTIAKNMEAIQKAAAPVEKGDASSKRVISAIREFERATESPRLSEIRTEIQASKARVDELTRAGHDKTAAGKQEIDIENAAQKALKQEKRVLKTYDPDVVEKSKDQQKQAAKDRLDRWQQQDDKQEAKQAQKPQNPTRRPR